MKKLILGLIAAVLISFSANAQTNVYAKSGMVILVTQAKSSYVKGSSYKDWLTKQTGSSTSKSPEEEKLFREVYGFLSTNSNAETIFKNSDGSSLVELAKARQKDGVLASEPNAKCGFWCQLIIEIIQIIIDTLPLMP
ncbi:MAG: hypothetical protein JST78_10100 [Bacteroidetes bacterium]|nr:hypothetical protein [Bacteroidota bacterium]